MLYVLFEKTTAVRFCIRFYKPLAYTVHFP